MATLRTAPGGGLAPEVRRRKRTRGTESGSKQRPTSITTYLRSVKLNDLLYPLVPSNKPQRLAPESPTQVWPFSASRPSRRRFLSGLDKNADNPTPPLLGTRLCTMQNEDGGLSALI